VFRMALFLNRTPYHFRGRNVINFLKVFFLRQYDEMNATLHIKYDLELFYLLICGEECINSVL
jgi:hypothetical protein